MKKINRREFIKRTSLAAISISPAMNALSQLVGGSEKAVRSKINCAFRLTSDKNMLNVEFYFMSCDYNFDTKIPLPRMYGQGYVKAKENSFMIVRLPQQHIAEQYFQYNENPSDSKQLTKWEAATRISGYSYIVFKIKHKARIYLKKTYLLDWNSENLELSITPKWESKEWNKSLFDSGLKNNYPLNYETHPNSHEYNYEKLPFIENEPVTVIESPWRLYLSPCIDKKSEDDSGNALKGTPFKFHWTFSKAPLDSNSNDVELWSASLSIIPDKTISNANVDFEKRKFIVEELEKRHQFGLMMVGTPDILENQEKQYTVFVGKKFGVLPDLKDKKKLVDLFIKYKLKARTHRLTFTPLGLSGLIEFKNERVLGDGDIYEWKQHISYGRDEEVKIAELIIDKDFGNKWLHILTTRRETRNGISFLNYRTEVVPLETEKNFDYEDVHSNGVTSNGHSSNIVTKRDFPFKRIEFADITPKQADLPQNMYGNKTELSCSFAYIPEFKGSPVKFTYKATDWQNNVIYFEKQIHAIQYKLVEELVKQDVEVKSKTLNEIDKLFYSGIEEYDKKVKDFSTSFSKFKDEIREDEVEVKNQLDKFKNLIASSDEQLKKVLHGELSYLKELTKSLISDLDEQIFKEFERAINIVIDNVGSLKVKGPIQANFNSYLDFIKEVYKSFEDRLLYVKGLPDWNVDGSIKNKAIFELETFFSGIIFSDLKRYEKEKLDEIEGIRNSVRDKINNIRKLVSDEKKKLNNYINELEEAKTYTKEFITAIKKNIQEIAEKNLEKIEDNCDEILRFVVDSIKEKRRDFITPFKDKKEKYEAEAKEIFKIVYMYEYIEYKIEGKEILVSISELSITLLPGLISDEVIKKWKVIKKLEYALPRINLNRQVVGYTESRLKDAAKALENEISLMETDYLVLKGVFKDNLDNAYQFFEENFAVPKLESATVYVSKLTKLVNEEVPIEIKYAEDYLVGTWDQNKNASKVFAEVLETSRENLKGKIRNISGDLGGLVNPELPIDYISYLRKEVTDKKEDIYKGISDIKPLLKEYSDLIFIDQKLVDNIKKQVIDERVKIEDLKFSAETFFTGLNAKIFGTFDLKDILKEIADLKPPTLTISGNELIYQFIAQIPKSNNINKDGNDRIKLEAKDNSKIIIDVKKKINEIKHVDSVSEITDFKVSFYNIIIVHFKSFKFSKPANSPIKVNLELDKNVGVSGIEIKGALDFIGQLSRNLQIPGTGLRLVPSLRNIEIGYTMGLPSISLPGFTLSNIKFDFAINIPLPTSNSLRPLSISISLNRPEDKFVVAAGIYGGRGHSIIELTTEKIIKIDLSIEFGGYFGMDIGIAKGYVLLMAGIRYLRLSDSDNSTEITAYVICCGSVCAFGIVSITVTFIMALQAQNGDLRGSASVTYCVKVAFFRKSFTLHYEHIIEGSKNNGSAGQAGGAGGAQHLIYSDDNDQMKFNKIFPSLEKWENYWRCFL